MVIFNSYVKLPEGRFKANNSWRMVIYVWEWVVYPRRALFKWGSCESSNLWVWFWIWVLVRRGINCVWLLGSRCISCVQCCGYCHMESDKSWVKLLVASYIKGPVLLLLFCTRTVPRAFMASEEYIPAAGNQGKWCPVIEHTIDSAEVFVQTVMPEAENDE